MAGGHVAVGTLGYGQEPSVFLALVFLPLYLGQLGQFFIFTFLELKLLF